MYPRRQFAGERRRRTGLTLQGLPLQPEIDVPAGATNVAVGGTYSGRRSYSGDSDATELGN